MTLVVTSNRSPDIDGTACILAYSELLSSAGEENAVRFSSRPDPLGSFALRYLGLRPAKAKISPSDRIILVDASQLKGLPREVDPEKVAGIIDHRSSRDLHHFPNAIIQNEPVGAAATLVSERFRKAGVVPSRASAALLYSAIAVNTVNFRAKVTTARDRAEARRLLKIAGLPKNYLKLLFRAAEDFRRPLAATLEEEFASQDGVGIVQLETADGAAFIRRKYAVLSRELPRLFKRKGVSVGFLSCLDLGKGRNVFLAPSPEARKFIRLKIRKTRFFGPVGTRILPIMRKEIWRLL